MEAKGTAASIRFSMWTFLVLVCGVAPWLVGIFLGQVPFGGCGNPGAAVGAVVGGLLFLPAVLSPICVIPAIVGYVVAVLRAREGYPERRFPPEALSGYAYLCGAIVFAVTWATLLFFLYRTAAGGGLLVLGVGIAGLLFLVVLFVWSIVVGLRLARIGRAVHFASAVCVRCGFAVRQGWHLGCPICGGDVCLTERELNLGASEPEYVKRPTETTGMMP